MALANSLVQDILSRYFMIIFWILFSAKQSSLQNILHGTHKLRLQVVVFTITGFVI